MIRLSRKSMATILTVLAIFLAGGSVYAIKPGSYPPIERYGHYNETYDVAFLYGGGTQRGERIEYTAELYEQGYFPKIMPLGNRDGIGFMRNRLMELSVPNSAIIIPVQYSRNTIANLRTGNETVRSYRLGNRIAHVSSRNHLPRIRGINETISVDLNPYNDGYFPSDDGYGESIFYLLITNPGEIRSSSDVTEWFASIKTRWELGSR